MIKDLSNDAQFEKSQSRTGHPDNSDKVKNIDSTEDKSATIRETIDVTDSKNDLKDEGMSERDAETQK